MKVLIEGDVFRWQRHGGITRIYERTFPCLETMSADLEISVALPAGTVVKPPRWLSPYVVRYPQLRAGLRPWRVWHRVSPVLNRALAAAYWASRRADVFLSTYFVWPRIESPGICVVYDMIPELFPDSLDREYGRMVRRRKQTAVEKAALVLCISQQTRSDVVRLLGVPADRCRVVHLASGLEHIAVADAEAEKNAARPFYLFVGYHRPAYKNFPLVLRSFLSNEFEMFSNSDLVVVSPTDPDEEELRMCRQAVTQGRIRFLRGCTDGELARLYSRCAALLYPSHYEGFGIPVLEALQFGAPVVCANGASLPEVGGDAVYYFDPRSAGQFQSALERAALDGRRADAVARRRAQAGRFSWNATARGFMEVLRSAASMA